MNVGKNAEDNWKLLSEAVPQDLWFHVSGGPSAHVFLSNDHITPQNIHRAACLTKERSKFKTYSRVKITYCPVANIKRGSKPGEVMIRSNKKCRHITV